MLLPLSYAKRRLMVDVEFNNRKNLSITVHPDQRITAKAPQGYELNTVLQRIEKRAPWIIRQLDYFEQFQPALPERQYVNGETHHYLGRELKYSPLSRQKDREVKQFYCASPCVLLVTP